MQPNNQKFTNRLIQETSPYLLQHAHNPVDWFPWGDEAFEKASVEHKPIFLSIGYSSCHWCHVMEKESFENLAVAEYLNQHFVSIKVDREERPDIDRIYMDAVVGMTGSGGWPLSVFLTPDRKPFYGGTYFPPVEAFGRPGFLSLLQNIQQVWETRKHDVLESADQITESISRQVSTNGADSLASNALRILTDQLAREFDSEFGGFIRAPKFPPSSEVSLLLRQNHHNENKQLLSMAEATLRAMAQGGMYDQLGGGFHRYSTDIKWLVPHFEKMLYDNAQLAVVYYEAYQITNDRFYRQIADQTLDYVLRDLTDSNGGFHSSEDADSEGEEGIFYVWTPNEITEILNPETSELVQEYYGVTEQGNFENGTSILHIPVPLEQFAKNKALSESHINATMNQARYELLAIRAGRIRPGKDDKIIASWNGLMIRAFCKGYQITGNRNYLYAAVGSADFILSSMRNKQGELFRIYRAGEAKVPGFIDDYAFVIAGLIDLYESTFDWKWLEAADDLTHSMMELFWDNENAGFYFHSGKDQSVINRTKEYHDKALPSGNAVAVQDLLRLAVLLNRDEYRQNAHRTLLALSMQCSQSPRGYEETVVGLEFLLHTPPEIAIVGSADAADTRQLIDIAYTQYLPDRIIALLDPISPQAESYQKKIPLLKGKTTLNGTATVYVCHNYSCNLPVAEPENFLQQITSVIHAD